MPKLTKMSVSKRPPQFYSPFRYPGGKSWLLPVVGIWLRSLHNRTRLCEPFAGGASVGLFTGIEGLAESVYFCEQEPRLADFWRTVFSPGGAERLATRVETFYFTETKVRRLLAEEAARAISEDRAFLTLLRNRVSRAGLLAPGAGLLRSGEAGKGLASRWYPATLAARLRLIAEHRKRFQLDSEDGFTQLAQRSCAVRTVWFIDPPYPKAGGAIFIL